MQSDLHSRLRAIFRQTEETGGWLCSEPVISICYHGSGRIGSAAVLCCIRETNSRLELLLTKRSESVSTHRGEVCFPGGMKDPSDHSLMETALREAMEEVNLLPDQVEVVGALPPIYRSISSNHITLVTPFVAILSREAKESLQLVPNEEVEQIFWVPLHLFVSGGPYHSPVNLHFAGDGYSDNQFSLNHLGIDCVVWGMTAALSISVASIVLQIPVHFPFTILLSSRVEEEASRCILHVAPLRLPTGSSQEDGVSSSQSVRAKL